jgi:hypothetical protein
LVTFFAAAEGSAAAVFGPAFAVVGNAACSADNHFRISFKRKLAVGTGFTDVHCRLIYPPLTEIAIGQNKTVSFNISATR